MFTPKEIELTGNLGADPVDIKLKKDRTGCRFRLAINEEWTDKDGEVHERVEWWGIVIFNSHLAKLASKYLRKGSRVMVRGIPQQRTYTDKDGVERAEVVVVLRNDGIERMTFLDGKYAEQIGALKDAGMLGARHDDEMQDDEIPF